MRITLGSWFFLLALILLCPSASHAVEKETLLAPMPEGFAIGFQGKKNNLTMVEMVPSGETVEAWSRMVTVQIFHALKKQNADTFAENMGKMWSNACPGSAVEKVKDGADNGFPYSLWQYLCPLNKSTQKPENVWIKVISGDDALYTVQYAYRQGMTDMLVPPAMKFLDSVKACDTRREERPCPAVKQ
jgi:hypothetical protein